MSKTALRLISALQQDEFVLYRQPIVRLHPRPAERPFQEILVRFQEEEDKLLPPGTFLPVLEEERLMPYLDRWVVSKISKWIRRNLAARPDWHVTRSSINISADTFHDSNFAEFTRKHIESARLPATAFCFEIGWDGANSHAEAFRKLVLQLRPIGCRFTIGGIRDSDACWRLIERLNPDFVKISTGITRSIVEDPADFETTRAISRECRSHRITTIAEQVESAEALLQLRRAKVDFAQGFGISAPGPLEKDALSGQI